MPCPWPREVASTVAEHTNLAARDRVSTHAPGRIEGSREHTNLAIASERNNRLGLDVRVLTRRATCARLTRTKADAIGASATAAVAARTTRSRVEPLPSDLPDASRDRPRDLSTHDARTTHVVITRADRPDIVLEPDRARARA